MNNKRWITKNGYRILINNYTNYHPIKPSNITNSYMNDKIKTTFTSTTNNEPKEEIITLDTDLPNGANKMKAKKVNGLVIGTLYYKTKNDKTKVFNLDVHPDYRRKGYATELLKDLQKEVGDADIDFDILTPDGKALINKIGVITSTKKGKYDNHYIGRIKL